MALRLGDAVVCGEINNTTKNSVSGWLGLRDREDPLPLHLTGNCSADLAGRHIRFTARRGPRAECHVELDELAAQQIGPTGVMTAAREVRASDCSPTEFYRRAQLGETPPATLKPSLYLEWFSQNGRVVVELIDPEIEFVEDEQHGAGSRWKTDGEQASQPSAPFRALLQDESDAEQDSLLDDEDDLDDLDDDDDDEDDDFFDDDDDDDDDDESEDPYGLFPNDLQRQLDRQSEAADEAIESDDELPEVMRELELMDSLIERGADVPVGSIFDPPIQLPPVGQIDRLSDEEVETALKSLLARMAQYGIALDICEHFTPRETYKLLLQHICQEEGAFPELRQTQWVQHFMTHDFCPICEVEMEQRWSEENSDDADADDDTDDDVPF